MLWFLLNLLLVNGQELQASGIKGDCIVDGHGPYPETRSSCMQQARDQARTNCVLSQNASRIEFSFKFKGNTHVGSCNASPLGASAGSECQVGKCFLKH